MKEHQHDTCQASPNSWRTGQAEYNDLVKEEIKALKEEEASLTIEDYMKELVYSWRYREKSKLPDYVPF